MRERFGAGGAGDERCPGEKQCQIFAAAYGASRNEKLQNSCFGCHLINTKTSHAASEQMEGFIRHILRLARELRFVRETDLTKLSSLEWESLLLLDFYQEHYETRQQGELKDLLKAFLGVKAAGI